MSMKMGRVCKYSGKRMNISFICLLFVMYVILGNSQSLVEVLDISQSDGLRNESINRRCQQFPDFREYVIMFKKNYTLNSSEYYRRQQIYKKRVEYLRIKCMDINTDYQVCVNKFSDLTQEQRISIYMFILGRKPLLEVDQNQRKVELSRMIKIKQSSGVPISLDWRTRNVITSIKDQGSCGSCWTFATNAYGQSRMVIKNLSDISIDLSEQYLLSCTPDCTCDGGYLEYVFQKAATGVPLESSYSYSPYSLVSPFICWAGSKKYFGYIPQKHYDLSDEQLISLLQVGPVAISISATNWQDYKSGVFRCNSVDKVNHAVLLIGYTNDYWIVKNQWGADWGENGFIRVSRNRLNNCKIGASAFTMWEAIMGGLMLMGMVMMM